MSDFMERKNTFILFGIVLLGALLRLYHINYQSLWLDELYSIVPTSPKLSVASIIEYCKTDQPPTFFLYIHYVFKLFGYNEAVGRLACAAIGIVAIPVMYLLGRECAGKHAGLFAAIITSVNYFHIYYSQELRFYSMAFFLSALSYLFFIRAYKRNQIVDFIGYSVATIGLLYTHYYGMIIFFTQGLTFLFLLKYKRDNKFIFSSIASGLIIVAAFSPWLPTIFTGLGDVLPHIKMPNPEFVLEYFYYYTGKDALSTSVFCYCIFLFAKTLFSKREIDVEVRPLHLIILIWIIISYLFPYLRSIMVTPMVVDRYTIVTLPAWIALIAIGWNRIHNYKVKYALPIVITLSAIINLFFVRQYYTRIKKDQWREASSIVLAKNQSHLPVYSTLAWHFSFYFRDQPEKILDLYSSDLAQVDELWFLTAHFTEDQMDAQIISLQGSFAIVERHTFFGANAVLLKRKATN